MDLSGIFNTNALQWMRSNYKLEWFGSDLTVKTVLLAELTQDWVVFAKIDNITFTSSIQQIKIRYSLLYRLYHTYKCAAETNTIWKMILNNFLDWTCRGRGFGFIMYLCMVPLNLSTYHQNSHLILLVLILLLQNCFNKHSHDLSQL